MPRLGKKSIQKIVYNKTVFEGALERIRYLFDEFEDVVVGFSGGKDSTVTLEMALIVAKEKNRLPLKVLFLDQEAERTGTVDYVREVMNRKEVEPMWFQIPFNLFNSTSFTDSWLHCWEEGKEDERIRPKEPNSIKENVFTATRFVELFTSIAEYYRPKKKMCYLSGVRCEESPQRYMGLTGGVTYKRVTWGKKLSDHHYTFYPLYDRTYIDIWKSIHDNKRNYNIIYDYQYRYGIDVRNMRVSSLIHETAVRSLFYLPEVDKELYEKITKRIPGISTANHMNFKDFFPKDLPFMFNNWREYRDYLLENLITDKTVYKNLKDAFVRHDGKLEEYPEMQETIARRHTACIVTNDIDLTKIKGIEAGELNLFVRDMKRLKAQK